MKRKSSVVVTVACLAAVALAGAMLVPTAALAAPSQNTFAGDFAVHGVLEGLPHRDRIGMTPAPIVDEANRRLYVLYKDVTDGFGPGIKVVLNEYDLGARGNPPLLRSAVVGTGAGFAPSPAPYGITLDPVRRRLSIVGGAINRGTIMDRIDLTSMTALPTVDLNVEAPGFAAQGITYSAADDRYFLLGELSGGPAVSQLLGIPGVFRGGPAIVALDGDTGARDWVRPVAECQQPLVSFGTGALVARSSLRDALYFFCQPGGGTSIAALVGQRNPGQSAVVRLSLAGVEDQASAVASRVDVFPVSGSYQAGEETGVAAFDPGSDRFIVQSRAVQTPGAWVFDGRLEAWSGFVTAPDANNAYIGVNTRTGRHYMGGQVMAGGPIKQAYLNASDIRLAPVPQGTTTPLADGYGVGNGYARLAVDSAANRLFLPDFGPSADVVVVEDVAPAARPEPALNFDRLTSDEPITDATLLQYSSGAAGFGANLRLAGGLAAGFSGVPGFVGETIRAQGIAGVPPCVSVGIDDVSCISGGDRQLTVGSVPAVDLRNSGASAQATALELDGNTDAERDGARRAVRNRTDGDDDGLSSALNPVFGRVDCLDGGGDRQARTTPEKPLGSAHVVCDLARNTVTAASAFGDVAGEAVAISSSTFDTRSALAPDHRSITQSTADARGVRIGSRAGTHVTIGAVETVAATVAGGRPGTTLARWQRTVSGVRVQDAQGNETLASPGCSTLIEAVGGKDPRVTQSGNCKELVKQLNAALKGRAEVRLPEPEIVATPRGAFAEISKTQRDFLQASTLQNDDRDAIPGLEAIVFNDGEEKSRVVVQLAGVQANSIFLISNFGAPVPWDFDEPAPSRGGATPGDGQGATATGRGGSGGDAARGGAVPGADGAPAMDGLVPGPADVAPAAPVAAGDIPAAAAVLSGPIPERIAAGLRWLAREPGEAVLVGAMWLLFGAALMATVRRCLLLRQLQI